MSKQQVKRTWQSTREMSPDELEREVIELRSENSTLRITLHEYRDKWRIVKAGLLTVSAVIGVAKFDEEDGLPPRLGGKK